MKYVVITPARNEEAFLEKTILSMITQTSLPERWVIVDDGSTDRTASIAAAYADRFPWIRVIRLGARVDRNFAGKVRAFNVGLEGVQSLEFDLIANLDADISFSPDHFEFLIGKFLQDPKLGVAGTAYTQRGWDSTKDSFEGNYSVHGACQLFRYECFLDIGGYVPNPAGGIDWMAVTTARMRGWKTRNFPDRRYDHLRTMGTAERSAIGATFDYGKKDYYLGGSLVWQLFRAAYRMSKRPIIIGGLALLWGYCWASLAHVQRPVSADLMKFHRMEQKKRLKSIVGALIRFRKPEKFHVTSD